MYKFLMVDDEEIIRRGFETKIDWSGAGFQFLPPCANGRDAIKAIEEMEPDVVMTDIHMPHADGIAVAAYVMDRRPGTIVVILSGYDEFGYAQAAIRTKVFDYVLKPVSSRDLSVLLVKIKAKLDADRRSREDEAGLRALAGRTADLERELGLAGLISGSIASIAPEEAEAALGFDPRPLCCAVLVAELDAPGGSPDGLRPRVERAVAGSRRSAVLQSSEGRATALVFDVGIERCRSSAETAALTLIASEGPPVRVGISRAYGQWIDAPRAYAEAVSTLSYRLARGASKPFLYTQATEDREAIAELRSREERLRLGLRTGASDQIEALGEAYLEALGAAEISPRRVHHEVLGLFSRARDDLAAIGIGPAELSAKLGSDYYRFVESLDAREAVAAALAKLAEAAAEALEASSLHDPEWKVLDFKDLVARHYAEPGLSIAKAADRLSISESYLSKLIRRRLGTSFVDFLSGYRIERAKELLAASDMKAYEIAEAVGYPDARYFASLFKRRTGATPSEYRASLGGAKGGPRSDDGGGEGR